MGIKEGIREINKETVTISLNIKNFSEMGYWVRDIKKKLKDKELLRIKVTLNIDYFDNKKINY